jgi:hypothetical protein
MRPRRAALIVHTFTRSVSALEPVWTAAAALDMDRPIGRWPVELPVGWTPLNPAFTMLAGRQRLRSGEFHQAIAYRVHDVWGASVLLGPNDDRVSWDELDHRWLEAQPEPPADAIGTVTVYAGLVSMPRRWRGGPADPGRLARQMEGGRPEPIDEWADAWSRTDRGVITWELPAGDLPTGRRLVAVAAAENEPALDDWIWAADRPGLPTLTQYLLHAAKLRYQHRVLEQSLPSLRATVSRVEENCALLDGLLNAGDPPLSQLLAADRAVSVAQTDQNGLIKALGNVRDMARTVRVAERNMAATLGETTFSATAGPPSVDRDLAEWTREQLLIEETYLNSAHQRVREAGRLAGTVIDQRQRQRQEGLTLLQTSIIGALLMALAAVQSFAYQTPLPAPLTAPTIGLLAVVALLLPPAVLRSPGLHTTSRRRWAVAGAAGLTGAVLGWFGATLAWELETGRGAPEVWSLSLAGGGFLVSTAIVLAMSFGRAASLRSG